MPAKTLRQRAISRTAGPNGPTVADALLRYQFETRYFMHHARTNRRHSLKLRRFSSQRRPILVASDLLRICAKSFAAASTKCMERALAIIVQACPLQAALTDIAEHSFPYLNSRDAIFSNVRPDENLPRMAGKCRARMAAPFATAFRPSPAPSKVFRARVPMPLLCRKDSGCRMIR